MKTKGPLILVIDDEADTLKYVSMNLRARGYDVLTAADGTEGLKLFGENLIDLVLLDIAMPGPDGLQVCKHISSTSETPVIVLSARGRERDKVTALDLGAVDYVTKPFGVEELLARVRAALRRAERAPHGAETTYQMGDIVIDLGSRTVLRNGEPVRMTRREFAVLSLLVRNAGKVLSHKAILAAVWGGEYGGEKEYLWAYISRLRSKLEADPNAPALILNEQGVGYRLAAPPAA